MYSIVGRLFRLGTWRGRIKISGTAAGACPRTILLRSITNVAASSAAIRTITSSRLPVISRHNLRVPDAHA